MLLKKTGQRVANRFGIKLLNSRLLSFYFLKGVHMNNRTLFKDPVTRKSICDEYQSFISICKIAKEYGVSEQTINRLLREENIAIRDHSHKARKYTINEDYFDNLDTSNKNYVLGLFITDGCNYPKQSYSFISLQEKDKDILEKIKIEMNINKPLNVRELSKENKNWQDAYRLDIRNKKISSRLNELGVVPKKSLIVKFPDYIEEKYMPDFIRGVIDGDGCVFLGERAMVTMASTEWFCYSMRSVLASWGIRSYVHDIKKADPVIKCLSVTGNYNAAKFLDIIYRDSELHIDRKYEKYQQIYRLYGK